MSKINYSLNHKSMYNTIADRLEEMILNDSSQIDQRLPSEQALAVSFGVSRPVIREALKLLKERGLINQRQGGRTVICEPNSEQLTNSVNRIVRLKNVDAIKIFEIRIALELLSANTAAQNATADDINTLRQIVYETRAAEQSGNMMLRTQCDLKFHRCVAEIGGNPLLCIFLESIEDILNEMIRTSLCDMQTSEDGVKYHERLIHAIEIKDPQKAKTIMREHLTLSMRNYEFSLQNKKVCDLMI